MRGDNLFISATKPPDDKEGKIKPTPPGRENIPLGKVDEVAEEVLGLSQEDHDLYGLQLDILESDAVLFEEQASYHWGGDIATNNPGSIWNECTSGFSVSIGPPSGYDHGFLTAGHCAHEDIQYRDRFSGEYASLVPDGLRDTYRSYGGDFAVFGTKYTQPSIYSDSSIWMDEDTLMPIRSVDTSVNIYEFVCFYSRHAGIFNRPQLDCGWIDYMYIWYNGVGGLVAVSDLMTTIGDSGGPWFSSTRAHGIHTGSAWVAGSYRSIFSHLAYLNYAFYQVEVQTCPSCGYYHCTTCMGSRH